jgi:hypothetical protein
MRRRGVVYEGVVLLTVLAFAAPAQAAGGSATDQGYPCATNVPAPPGQTSGGMAGQCQAAVPSSPSGPAVTPAAQPSTPAAQPTAPIASGGIAGAQATLPAARGGVAGVQASLPTKQPAGAVAPASGTLPFTGLQLAAIGLLGVGLIAGGMALRASRRRARD